EVGPVVRPEGHLGELASHHRVDLASVSVPSLIVQCTRDAVAPIAVGEYMHQQLPQSRMTLIDAVGHCPHVSHPEATIRAIRGYLDDRRAEQPRLAEARTET
ncbi:MAG: alpha/beta hydrolase, partial [Candidatus Limnocylindria bacterium]